MKMFKFIALLLLSPFFLYHPTLGAGPAVAINPCPPAYQFVYFNDIENWNVCIASNIFSVNEEESFDYGCPLIINGNHKQAWNPEAGICFSLDNNGNSEIFSITREISKHRLLVDLHTDNIEAGCFVGSPQLWLLSPGDVYCLKGDEPGNPVSFTEIEGQLDEYFELLLSCANHNRRELSAIMISYQQYLNFAYYDNPNIEIEWDEVTFDLSLKQARAAGSTIDTLVAEQCDDINVRRITGVTN